MSTALASRVASPVEELEVAAYTIPTDAPEADGTLAREVPNLFIADGSVMPTQGSANPALTIMALASRLAVRLDRGRVNVSSASGRRPQGRRQTPPSQPSAQHAAPAGSPTDAS
jgi:hypothetical protein